MEQFRHSVIAHALDLVLPPPPPTWPWPLTLPQMRAIRMEPNKPTIQAYSTNFLVTYLQILLIDMTGATIPEASGIFDGATHEAVVNFQRYLGLHDDGVVGPITWNCVDVFLADPFLAKHGG
jgi:peptidoglycan hydrolase-like protein with peptidoglycan-binding domain